MSRFERNNPHFTQEQIDDHFDRVLEDAAMKRKYPNSNPNKIREDNDSTASESFEEKEND